MAIWTQRTSVSWKQSVSYFEHRYEVLRTLEDAGLLRRFQSKGDRILMRLGSAHQIMSFGPSDFSMADLKPGLDEGVTRAAAEAVYSALKPELVGRPNFGIQSLVPIAMPYDEARQAAGRALLPGLPGNTLDFGLLLDGTSEQPPGEYRLEVGVVEAKEAPTRLSREVGRVATRDAETPPFLWQPNELPEVALFCDIGLKTEPLQENTVESLFATLASVRDVSDELVSSFMQRLALESNDGTT
jgi:hypothetical protein